MYEQQLKQWLPKAKPISTEAVAEHKANYCHLKLDGHCCVVYKPPGPADTKPVILTRQGENITHDLLWHPIYGRALLLPQGHAIAGELWKPGVGSSGVRTAINRRDAALHYHAFSIPTMPAHAPLQTVHTQAIAWGFDFINYYTDRVPYPFTREALPPDIEGYVFKDFNLIGHRKWKPVLAIELIVTGWKPAKEGKFVGQLGALLCSTYAGNEVASVGTMPDKLRWEFTQKPPIGDVVEVVYQEIGSKGRLRFPRYKLTRHDKAPEDCTECQDKALEAYWITNPQKA